MNKFFQGYKYLGCANEWENSPVELQQCKELGHRCTEIHESRGMNYVYCTKCGIYYDYDSGD